MTGQDESRFVVVINDIGAVYSNAKFVASSAKTGAAANIKTISGLQTDTDITRVGRDHQQVISGGSGHLQKTGGRGRANAHIALCVRKSGATLGPVV
ncbi:MAG: hypothetical protein BWY72_01584 [Bacteroidetes bacterium ADurb.Bin416]|nr:MAG: hypothetical protein BWY72_01584 [Bacteroidetes bacterium ADurb.Bin416]